MILSDSEIMELIRSSPPLISGWIDLETQLQPAGFDLSLREVRRFKDAGCIDFDNSRRRIASTEPVPFSNDFVKLDPGAYLVVFNEVVSLPLDIVAIAKPRSSLLRSGATVETAVWDPGYRGRSKALLIVYNRNGLILSRNARLVQLVFIRLSKASRGYKGVYLGEK